MVRNEGNRLIRAVVCTPNREYTRYRNHREHNIAHPANRVAAAKQHQQLKDLLNEFGCIVIEISELEGHPNSVFTRDMALSTPEGTVQLRMGLDTRLGEEIWMSEILNSLGIPSVGQIQEPGTIEGGDVILAGHVAFVGHSSRTNLQGIAQIRAILSTMGYEVRVASIPDPYLHIGGAMSLVAPDTVLTCMGVFPNGYFDGFQVISVPEVDFASGNVICLEPGNVVADASASETIRILRSAGITVQVLNLSEFAKGTGGPSCLILPIDRT